MDTVQQRRHGDTVEPNRNRFHVQRILERQPESQHVRRLAKRKRIWDEPVSPMR